MYRVRIEDFEGPLDLLLYFIRRDELDIFDIPIAQITDEYLEYVKLLERVDLDSVGDFLYMAALLINIKARMLLPQPDVEEDGESLDPRRELVERLLEYIRYKEASANLVGLREERSNRFTRGEASSERTHWEGRVEPDYDATVFDLISALRRILTAAPEEPTHSVETEVYTIEEQQEYILRLLEEKIRVSFAATMGGRSKAFVIAAFLAILELARQQRITIDVSPEGPVDFFLEAADGDSAETVP